MIKEIPNCIPYVGSDEKALLSECIDTGFVSSVGPLVNRFEDDFAKYHGVKKSSTVSSGTAAIHLALLALGVKRDDLVLCPSVTFIGTANPIRYCGADPIFIGVERESLSIDPLLLRAFLSTEAKRDGDRLIHIGSGRCISAIIVVHLFGNPAPMDDLIKISEEFDLPIVEDAAESLGARYHGELVGTIGDIAAFSFNGNKVITTGGGGVIISRDDGLTSLCKHLSTQAKADGFEFIHDHVGFNYRMSNLNAAVGVAQLSHLNEYVDIKRNNATKYRELLAKNGKFEIMSEPQGCRGSYWMSVARLTGSPNSDHIERLKRITAQGIGVRPIWYPLHKLPIYSDTIYYGSNNEEGIYNSTICLPSSVGITEGEILRVVRELEERY